MFNIKYFACLFLFVVFMFSCLNQRSKKMQYFSIAPSVYKCIDKTKNVYKLKTNIELECEYCSNLIKPRQLNEINDKILGDKNTIFRCTGCDALIKREYRSNMPMWSCTNCHNDRYFCIFCVNKKTSKNYIKQCILCKNFSRYVFEPGYCYICMKYFTNNIFVRLFKNKLEKKHISNFNNKKLNQNTSIYGIFQNLFNQSDSNINNNENKKNKVQLVRIKDNYLDKFLEANKLVLAYVNEFSRSNNIYVNTLLVKIISKYYMKSICGFQGFCQLSNLDFHEFKYNFDLQIQNPIKKYLKNNDPVQLIFKKIESLNNENKNFKIYSKAVVEYNLHKHNSNFYNEDNEISSADIFFLFHFSKKYIYGFMYNVK